MPSIDLDWKWLGEKLGVPTFIATILLAIIHFDLIIPIQNGISQGIGFQHETVKSLATLQELQRQNVMILDQLRYDTRHGTWRALDPPHPSSVPPDLPPQPTTKLQPPKPKQDG